MPPPDSIGFNKCSVAANEPPALDFHDLWGGVVIELSRLLTYNSGLDTLLIMSQTLLNSLSVETAAWDSERCEVVLSDYRTFSDMEVIELFREYAEGYSYALYCDVVDILEERGLDHICLSDPDFPEGRDDDEAYFLSVERGDA